jgi:dTDP-4-dehydrorhamnose 3,5-epimerase
MLFQETKLRGVFEIQLEPYLDERGFVAVRWSQKEFEHHGLNPKLAQCNLSFNSRKGILRGVHYQAPPHEQGKLVRCTRGSIYDVALDLRPQSPTFKESTAVVLTSSLRNMVYLPEGCAHGFLTLEDESEVFYQMSEFYNPESGRGARWNDPAFRIDWPEKVEVISERDGTYPNFKGDGA